MDPRRFRQIKSLYATLRNASGPERERALAELDAESRRALERLLQRAPTNAAAIEKALEGAHLANRLRGARAPGDTIGPYRLERVVGEGGMGIVYEARQSEPIERVVALKAIKPGMDTRQVLARFEIERQALAMLEHPSIAAVFGAGATGDGRPYFVMELVRGEPIDEYCDTRGLDLPARIGLFLQLCEGVRHAHQRAILHRDLKPSNVLVSEDEGEPRVKIIDFGLAKALDQRFAAGSLATRAGQILGTPEYMSPEQVELAGEVDTRADVFSLGAMLYQLLTGELPFGAYSSGSSETEIRRRVLQLDPQRPSSRGGDRRLRGDLDWIVMRAIEKDPERRYSSVADLAEDLRRHLADEPVLAGPPSARYRARKFVRRHRVAVTSAVIVAAALLVGAAGTGIGLARALRAEREARQQAETAQHVTDFMLDLFGGSDSRQTPGRVPTAEDLVDRGVERIETELELEPVVRARLLDALSRAYTGIGRMEEALDLSERALAIRRELFGSRHAETLESQHEVGFLYWAMGPVERAEDLLQEVYDVRREALGPDDPLSLATAYDLGEVKIRLGRFEEALALLEDSLDRARRVLGPDDPTTLAIQTALSATHRMLGDLERARPLVEDVLERRQRRRGRTDFLTASAMLSLALLEEEAGRLDRAEQLYHEARAIIIETGGRRHKGVHKSQLYLGRVLLAQGRWQEAKPLVEETADAWIAVMDPLHIDRLRATSVLGELRRQEGRRDEAQRLLRESWEGYRQVFGDEDLRTRKARAELDALLAEEAG